MCWDNEDGRPYLLTLYWKNPDNFANLSLLLAV
jgi:hypothetical protein